MTRRTRLDLGTTASLSAMALVLVLSVAYLAVNVVHADPFRRRITATMELTNSGSLGVNSPVLLTGVPVGRVTGVHRALGEVVVDFQIDGDYHVPAAGAVRIENLSALGEPYLEFAPTDSRGPYIHDHQRLDARSADPILIPQLSAKLVDLLHQLDPNALHSLINTADTALDGVDGVIPALARSSQLMAATLLSRDHEIHQLLLDLQTMGADMTWFGPTLAESGPSWGQFGSRTGQVVTTGSRLFEIGDSPHDYLTGDGVIPTLTSLTGVLAKLGPALSGMVPVLAPLTADISHSLYQLDIGTLIAQALNTVGDDGAIHLRLDTK